MAAVYGICNSVNTNESSVKWNIQSVASSRSNGILPAGSIMCVVTNHTPMVSNSTSTSTESSSTMFTLLENISRMRRSSCLPMAYE